MAKYHVNAPDGHTYEVEGPDGASQDDVVKAVLAQHPEAAHPQEKAQSWGDWALNNLKGFALGAEKPLDNLTQAAMHIPGAQYIDQLGQAIGLPSAQQAIQGNQQARQDNTAKVAQTIGNVAGTLPTLALPGGAVAQGAASGALLSDKDSAQGVLSDAVLGGAAGKIGQVAGNAFSAVARPVVSKAAQTLHDAGVLLTPGQLANGANGFLGRAAGGVEDRLAGLPVIGDVINQARGRGVTQLNHAVANDALLGIGETVPQNIGVGHELLDHVDQKLSDQYNKVVPNLVGHIDDQFGEDLAAAKSGVNVTGDGTQRQFENIVRDVFGNRMDETGRTIAGQNMKDAESRLTYLANKYAKSPDADQSILGESLFKVRQALRDMATRSDPSGAELQAINQGWAKLQQMRSAANIQGVFTPTALARVANKSGFGTDLARAAQQIMPNQVPDSGTAGRAVIGHLALGAGGTLAALSHPGPLVGGLAAAAPYTQMGQRALNAFVFAPRGAVAKTAANAFQKAAQIAPSVAPSLVRTGANGPVLGLNATSVSTP